jgi:Family of unknown function (DUF6515)
MTYSEMLGKNMKGRSWISMVGAVAVAFALAVGTASADPPRGERHEGGPRGGPGPRPGFDHMDRRFGHDHYYPSRGYEFRELPRDRVVVGGGRYYYSGGIWYEPRGPRFVVVGPPVGVYVPVLPAYYTTVYYGGVPYYYANDAYYQWVPEQSQYEVVAPPGDESAAQLQPAPAVQAAATTVTDDVFIYPKNGQSEEQQATDKYECHKWASQQSGFDPTQSGGGVPPEQNASAHAAYNRAIGACLEGRGYSVK